ncbi:MAG: AMP-binding protein [Candidatus Omnitrophota bacterium]
MIPENFVKTIEQSIKRHWNLGAFSDYNEPVMTYGQVAQKILWLHYIFEKGHVKRGDKIALLGRNCTNWGLVYLATVSYGAVIVPIMSDFHPDDFHHIVNHSDSILLFVSDNFYEKMDEAKMPNVSGIFSLKNFELLHSSKRYFSRGLRNADEFFLENCHGSLSPDQFELPPISNEEMAGIIYTSGTSGFSKGVMLPHNSLIANVRFARNNIRVKTGERTLSFLPLAHAFGCSFDLLFPFSIGCHVTFLGQMPTPKILIQALGKVRPRFILTVPLIMEKIYKKNIKPKLDKPSIKLLTKVPGVSNVIFSKIRKSLIEVFGGNFIEIVVGGAPLNEEVEMFFKRIDFPFTIGYGMTECGPLISYTSYPRHERFSVGKIMDTLDIRIDTSKTSAMDGSGEIQVKGENVMMGYYKNPEATRETLDKDGWLHTGDMGLIDANGFIYIKGRYKTMLLGPSGQNIYPEEIEAHLNNLPYVEESLVLERDQKIVALVYPSIEAVDAEKLNETELKEKMEENRNVLNEQLPAYCRVSKIELYPSEFEKTPTRKIKRYLYTT